MYVKEYTLRFEDRGEYLYAHLSGRDSFAASLSYWNEIADEARELGTRKVLVHEALEGDVSEAEIFEIMRDVLPSGIGVKVAFFDENQADAGINDLGELVAKNRGATAKICSTLEEAENWLLADD